jgi:isoleucyl-tRNA synthetase
MFQPVEANLDFPEQELAIGRFWKDQRIYEKSLAQRAGSPPFVFYEGPPTANGMPHPGHCLTRAIKDLFPRYKTMRGYRSERKAGWDTHAAFTPRKRLKRTALSRSSTNANKACGATCRSGGASPRD